MCADGDQYVKCSALDSHGYVSTAGGSRSRVAWMNINRLATVSRLASKNAAPGKYMGAAAEVK